MAFRWRTDDGPTLNAGLVALLFFNSIPPTPCYEKTGLFSVRKTKTQTSLCIRLAHVLFARYSNLLQAKVQHSSTLCTFKHVQIGFTLTYTYLHSLKTSFRSKCHFCNVLVCNFLRCTCLNTFLCLKSSVYSYKIHIP